MRSLSPYVLAQRSRRRKTLQIATNTTRVSGSLALRGRTKVRVADSKVPPTTAAPRTNMRTRIIMAVSRQARAGPEIIEIERDAHIIGWPKERTVDDGEVRLIPGG